MGSKSLFNLIVKHFKFLQEDYDFSFDSASYRYFNENVAIQIQHSSGELNVFFTSAGVTESLPEKMSKVLKKEFRYPEHFSPWVLSMGDVDSRLAYDAKVIKESANKLFS